MLRGHMGRLARPADAGHDHATKSPNHIASVASGTGLVPERRTARHRRPLRPVSPSVTTDRHSAPEGLPARVLSASARQASRGVSCATWIAADLLLAPPLGGYCGFAGGPPLGGSRSEDQRAAECRACRSVSMQDPLTRGLGRIVDAARQARTKSVIWSGGMAVGL